MILHGNKRSSGYRGLFSQGIRQPECEADRLTPAGADVSYPAHCICCTLQLSLTEALHYATDGFTQLPHLTANLPERTSLWTGQQSCFLLGDLALKPLPEHPLYWWIFLMFMSFCTITLRNFVVPARSVW